MKEQEPIVFIIDDDRQVRDGLHGLIRSVGLRAETFASAQDFLQAKRPDAPACAILDVRMPGLSGLDLQLKLSEADMQLPIIFITGHGDIPMSVGAVKAGAIEFLTKPFSDEVLLTAIRQALERSRLALTEQATMQELRDRYASLTPREQDVMRLVVSGLLNKQVADELGITESTVKAHRGQVMQKMKANSLADLVKMTARLDQPVATNQSMSSGLRENAG